MAISLLSLVDTPTEIPEDLQLHSYTSDVWIPVRELKHSKYMQTSDRRIYRVERPTSSNMKNCEDVFVHSLTGFSRIVKNQASIENAPLPSESASTVAPSQPKKEHKKVLRTVSVVSASLRLTSFRHLPEFLQIFQHALQGHWIFTQYGGIMHDVNPGNILFRSRRRAYRSEDIQGILVDLEQSSRVKLVSASSGAKWIAESERKEPSTSDNQDDAAKENTEPPPTYDFHEAIAETLATHGSSKLFVEKEVLDALAQYHQEPRKARVSVLRAVKSQRDARGTCSSADLSNTPETRYTMADLGWNLQSPELSNSAAEAKSRLKGEGLGCRPFMSYERLAMLHLRDFEHDDPDKHLFVQSHIHALESFLFILLYVCSTREAGGNVWRKGMSGLRKYSGGESWKFHINELFIQSWQPLVSRRREFWNDVPACASKYDEFPLFLRYFFPLKLLARRFRNIVHLGLRQRSVEYYNAHALVIQEFKKKYEDLTRVLSFDWWDEEEHAAAVLNQRRDESYEYPALNLLIDRTSGHVVEVLDRRKAELWNLYITIIPRPIYKPAVKAPLEVASEAAQSLPDESKQQQENGPGKQVNGTDITATGPPAEPTQKGITEMNAVVELKETENHASQSLDAEKDSIQSSENQAMFETQASALEVGSAPSKPDEADQPEHSQPSSQEVVDQPMDLDKYVAVSTQTEPYTMDIKDIGRGSSPVGVSRKSKRTADDDDREQAKKARLDRQ